MLSRLFFFLLFVVAACAGPKVSREPVATEHSQATAVFKHRQATAVFKHKQATVIVKHKQATVVVASEAEESDSDEEVPEENKVVEIAPGIYRQFIPGMERWAEACLIRECMGRS